MVKKEPYPFPDKYYVDPFGLDRYVVQEKTLFSWLSPSKLEKKWQTAELVYVLLALLVTVVVLLFLREVIVLFGVLAVVVVFGLLVISRPTYLQCEVTTIGLKVEDKYYYWPEITQFWFEAKGEAKVLHLRVLFPTLRVLKLIIDPTDEETLRTTIGTYLLYKKPQQTMWNKIYKKVTTYLPIDVDFLQF